MPSSSSFGISATSVWPSSNRSTSFDTQPMFVRRSTSTGNDIAPGRRVTCTSCGRMYACASSPSCRWSAPATAELPKCTWPSNTVPRTTFDAPTNPATNGVAGRL